MKMSIITPSIRPGGLSIVANALKKQNQNDWEWIICSPQYLEGEIKKYIKGIIPYKFIGNPQLRMGQFWDLNYSYNRLIKESKGDLVISWQDFIYASPDALEKFMINYEKTKGIISGVGDQYESLDKWGRPRIKIWSDPRKRIDQGTFYEINPEDCEWNFCMIPKDALLDVGGFCEELDFRGFGMDGYQVNERLDKLGYKFYLDQTNESFTIRHKRERVDWDKNNLLTNGEYEKVRQEFILKNQWPRMKYLTDTNSP